MNNFEVQTQTVFVVKHDLASLIKGRGLAMVMEDDEKEFYTFEHWMQPYITKAFVKVIQPNGRPIFESVEFEKDRKQRIAGPVSGAYMRFTDYNGRHRIVSLFGDYHETTTVCSDAKTIASTFHSIFSRNTIPLDVFGEVARTPLHRVQSAARKELAGKEPSERDATGVVQYAKEIREAGGRKGYFKLEDDSSGDKVDTLAKWNYMILACQRTNRFMSCPASIRFHWSDLRGDIEQTFRERVFNVSSFIFPHERKPFIGVTFAYLFQSLSELQFAELMFQRVLLDDKVLNKPSNPLVIHTQVHHFFEWCIANNFSLHREIPNDVITPFVSLFSFNKYPQKTFVRLYYDPLTKYVAKAILVLCAETLYKTVIDRVWREDVKNWIKTKVYESRYGGEIDAPLFSFVQDLSVLTRLERRWDVTKHHEDFHLDYSPVGIVYSGDAHFKRMKHFYESVYIIQDSARAQEISYKCISFGSMPLELLLVPVVEAGSFSTLVILPKYSGFRLDIGGQTPRQLLTEKVEARAQRDREQAKTWKRWFGLADYFGGAKKEEPIPLPPLSGPKRTKYLEPIIKPTPKASELLKEIRTYEEPIPPPPLSNVKVVKKGVTFAPQSELKRKNPQSKVVSKADFSFWKGQNQGNPLQQALQKHPKFRKNIQGGVLKEELGLTQAEAENLAKNPKVLSFAKAFIHNPSTAHIYVKGSKSNRTTKKKTAHHAKKSKKTVPKKPSTKKTKTQK